MCDNLLINNVTNISLFNKSGKHGQQVDIPRFEMTNLTASDIVLSEIPLVFVTYMINLDITNSNFTRISSFTKNGILLIHGSKSTLKFSNTIFAENAAIDNGIFVIISESSLECSNCTFEYNFSTKNTIFYVSIIPKYQEKPILSRSQTQKSHSQTQQYHTITH
jgi:hypothetical protein